jgi:hypothetical protein
MTGAMRGEAQGCSFRPMMVRIPVIFHDSNLQFKNRRHESQVVENRPSHTIRED